MFSWLAQLLFPQACRDVTTVPLDIIPNNGTGANRRSGIHVPGVQVGVPPPGSCPSPAGAARLGIFFFHIILWVGRDDKFYSHDMSRTIETKMFEDASEYTYNARLDITCPPLRADSGAVLASQPPQAAMRMVMALLC